MEQLEQVRIFMEKYFTFNFLIFENDIRLELKKMLDLPIPEKECDVYVLSVSYSLGEEPGLLQAIYSKNNYIIAYHENNKHFFHPEMKFEHSEKLEFQNNFIETLKTNLKIGLIPIKCERTDSF